MQYWLIKTDPESYSIDDLEEDGKTSWNGVRNYQARNFMNTMKKGDLVLFYHSQETPPAVVGVAKVARTAYPDDMALDPKSNYYDPKATPEKPTWTMVDIAFVKKFKHAVALTEIRQDKRLQSMALLQTGSRLSVQPASETYFNIIEALGS